MRFCDIGQFMHIDSLIITFFLLEPRQPLGENGHGCSGGAWFGQRWAMAHPQKKINFFSLLRKLQKYPNLKEFSHAAYPAIQPFTFLPLLFSLLFSQPTNHSSLSVFVDANIEY